MDIILQFCLLWMVTAHSIAGLVRIFLECVLMLFWSFAQAPGLSGGLFSRSTPDMVPWSLYSDSLLSSRPQPLVSGGDATPCEDTREDFGPSFLTLAHQVLLQGGFDVSFVAKNATGLQ